MPSLDEFLNRVVVLDTQGDLVYIGILESLEGNGYWLRHADVHNRSEGHSTNEKYINDATVLDREGARPMNRHRVFVERSAVVSISALTDVLADGIPLDENAPQG
jgi:esterase/lipase superfamily enzyme